MATPGRPILLIADAVLVNRTLLKKIFADACDVILQSDGKGALDRLRALPRVDLAILDALLPAPDAFDLLEAVRRDAALQDIPIIVTTSLNDGASELRAFDLGAADVLLKPYNAPVLKARVRNILDRQRNSHLAAQSIRLQAKVEQQEEMLRVTQYDTLTGLYTREAFNKRAATLIRQDPPGYYVLSCFDVDNFKVINDQYGIVSGDKALKHIAEAFTQGLASLCGIACRVAADNFALLYPARFADSEQIAQIHRRASALGGTLPTITFSIGRYFVDDPKLPVSAMYDRALLAKGSVKDHYGISIGVYTEAMRKDLLHQQEIIGAMDDALRRREFEVWLQPQYDHATGAMVGAEALVRWNRPGESLIFPGTFIPVFERNGFIYELDKYIWEQSCVLLRAWMDEGQEPLPISVNISRRDLLCPDFYEVITGLVTQYRIPLRLLRLEITESAFAGATEQLITMVERLHEHGFIIEIDDFGSGYSSFNTLKDVPADVLKIDMHFLEGRKNAPRGGSILESIVRMARWLGMEVIAEGVESKTQADFLGSVGCNVMQGYFYARPMPVEKYESLQFCCRKDPRIRSLETVAGLNADSFWDPRSIDTLIFSSYIGGACVLEFSNGRCELVRVNEKYREVIRSKHSLQEILEFDPLKTLSKQDVAMLCAQVEHSAASGDELRGELWKSMYKDVPVHRECIRYNGRVIAQTPQRKIVYMLVENITDQKQALEREQEAAGQLRFLNEVSDILLAEPDAGKAIRAMLTRILTLFQSANAYVCEFDLEKGVFGGTYMISASGYSAFNAKQSFPISELSEWMEDFSKNKHIFINEDTAAQRYPKTLGLLRAWNAHSVAAVPLRREGKLLGVMGVNDPRGHLPRVTHLVALGDYMSVLLTRRDLMLRIEHDNRALLSLMNDTPGGFVRIRVDADHRASLEFINDRFCSLVSMSRKDLTDTFTDDPYALIHPEDRAAVREMIRSLEQEGFGNTATVAARSLHGARGYIPLRIFCRITRADVGAFFLNLYYADMTEQLAEEQRGRELLDNLPCGAGIYEVTGAHIRALYLNRRYREITGRSGNALHNSAIADAIHPDDRTLFFADVRAALAQNRDIVTDLHILGGSGGYLPFHALGRVVRRQSGKTLIYGAFFPTTDEAIQARRMLAEAVRNLPAGIGLYEVRGNAMYPLYISDNVCALFGYTREEFNACMTGLRNIDTLPVYMESLRSLIEAHNGEASESTSLAHKKDGTPFYLRTLTRACLREDGAIMLYNTMTDVTGLRERERQSRFQAERYRLLVEMREPVLVDYDVRTDCMTTIVYHADAEPTETVYPNYKERVSALTILAPESRKSYADIFAKTIAAPSRGSFTYRADYGKGLRWYKASYTTLADEAGTVCRMLAMSEDIDAERTQQLRLLEKAEMDPITGLMNRASGEELLHAQLAPDKAHRLSALFMVDLDDFKRINDTTGHREGDAALHLFSNALRGVFRTTDILYRYGGDEFVVYMDNAGSRAAVERKAKELLRTVSGLTIPSGRAIHCSVGVTLVTSCMDMDTLLSQADRAMYASKDRGKNTYTLFDPSAAAGQDPA